MFKRIGLFLLTNVAVLVVLGVVLNIVSAVFGINFSNVAGKGQSYGTLLIFAWIVGFSGSIISLHSFPTRRSSDLFHHLFAHEQDDCQIDDGRADD